MSRFDRIERALPDLLDELAPAQTPDYFDAVLAETAAIRQRPAWAIPDRWLFVSAITSRAALFPRLPWRGLVAVALILLALVVGVILAGGDQRDLPPPFGPAARGLIAYAADGDIYTADALTGRPTALVTGPDVDLEPKWSLDGTSIAFLRETLPGLTQLHVVDPATAAVRRVSEAQFTLVSEYAFSPSGETVAVVSTPLGAPALSIVHIEDGRVTDVDLGMEASGLAFVPPEGRKIAFVGGTPSSASGQGLYVYDIETGDVDMLHAPFPYGEIVGGPSFTADGKRVAFGAYPADAPAMVQFMPTDGSEAAQRVAPPTGICCQSHPVFSHGGDRLALTRWYDDFSAVVAVVDPNVGGRGIEIGLSIEATATVAWSPDDSLVLVRPDLPVVASYASEPGEQVLFDPRNGQTTSIPWSSTSTPTWQRLPP